MRTKRKGKNVLLGYFRKRPPTREEILDQKFNDVVESIKYLTHHQDLRTGMLAMADAMNRLADVMRDFRVGAASVERLADLLEQTRLMRDQK